MIRSVFVFLSVLAGLGAGLRAEGLSEPSPWGVIVECQMVALPQKIALPMIPALRDGTRIDAAFATIQQMIARDEARLAANIVARSASGSRLVAESAEETRYPTEFDALRLPVGKSEEMTPQDLKHWPVTGLIPTAFETRNAGATLELEATVSSDGQWIRALVRAQHLRLLRFNKIDGGVLPSGARISADQPEFLRLEDLGSLQVRAGQRLLLAIHKVSSGEGDELELFFLRIRAQRTGVPSHEAVRAPGLAGPRLWPEEAPMRFVRTEVQMVSIPQQESLTLVPALLDGRTSQAAFDHVQAMLAEGRAKLLDWPVTWTWTDYQSPETSGRGVSATMNEIRYATEYLPPAIPCSFMPPQSRWGLVTPMFFEAPNIGSSLDTEARIVAGSRVIELNSVPQYSRFFGFGERRVQRSPLGIEGIMLTPKMWSSKTTARVFVTENRPLLVGSFMLQKPEPHVELFILRASTTVSPPDAKLPALQSPIDK